MIALIAAVAKNSVIGAKNELPWYLPEDLKRFKKLTTGKTVLMGRKTYESIIKRLGKPLPNRKNVVITRDLSFSAPEGVLAFSDLDRALETLKNQDLFVIGGGELFRQTFEKADTLYITHIEDDYEGDVFFPKIDSGLWQKTEEEKHDRYSFAKYKKKL